MPPWLSVIISPLGSLIGVIGQVVKAKYEEKAQLAQLEHERKMAVETRLTQLALDKQSQDSIWALEQIRKSGFSALRWVSFLIIWAPILLGGFYPVEVKLYFDNIAIAVPEWYIIMLVAVTGAVWGIMTPLMKFWSK